MESSKRIEYIDIAKGFAILCVVAGHVLCYDLYGFDNAWTASRLMQFICTFHVPLFFFLSGIVSVTEIKLGKIPSDIYKRFRQLLVPFFVIGSIYSLWNAGNLSFLTNEYKYGYWYLWVLFVYYVLLYPLALVKNRFGYWAMILVYSIIWLVTNHFVSKTPGYLSDLFGLKLIVSYFPYYVIGNVVKKLKLHELLFRNLFILIASFSIWMCSSLFTFHYGNYIVTTAIIIIIMNVCRKVELHTQSYIKKQLTIIGKNTLFIYCFHYFVIQMMKTTFFYEYLPKYSNAVWDLIICVLPVLIAVKFSLFIKLVICMDNVLVKYIFNVKAESNNK